MSIRSVTELKTVTKNVQSLAEGTPLVVLRYFGPEVNPQAPALGAYRNNKFN